MIKIYIRNFGQGRIFRDYKYRKVLKEGYSSFDGVIEQKKCNL